MTRTTLLRSTVVLIVIAAAGGDICRADPPDGINGNDSPLAPREVKRILQPRVAEWWNSGCKEGDDGEPEWGPCEDDDEITLTPEPFSLHVFHENATYNCCLDDIVISLFADGNLLVLTEEEVLPDPCYCICCYDAEATVVDLAPGEYVVEFWWYDYEMDDYRCYVEEVVIPGGGWPDGDDPPVAIDADDSPVAPGEVKRLPRPRVVELWNSDCLEDPGDAPDDWWPCEGDDAIELTVEGNTLHVLHTDITYNCCLDEIVISGIIEEGLVLLTEEEILTDPCDCICCYEAGATVVDLAPGTYLVVFCWFDYQTGEERCYEEEIVIP